MFEKMEILIEESVRNSLTHDAHSEEIGLLIGKYSESGGLSIVHLASTKNDEDTPTTTGPPRVGTVPVSLLNHHIKQLLRMLPGGLDILGLYVIEPEEIFTTKYEENIKTLLSSLRKQLGRNEFYTGQPMLPKIVLGFSLKTKKFQVKGFDKDGNNVKIDTAFGDGEWEEVHTDFDTSGVVIQQGVVSSGGQGSEGMEENVKTSLKRVLQKWKETLEGSRFILNGQVPSAETVYTSDESVSILIAKIPAVFINIKKDFVNHLHLQGKIHAVAFVNKGESTRHAVEMLRVDILRSLCARMEMHCESLIDEESCSESKVYHEIPRRVFVDLLNKEKKLKVSDYLFPGEGAGESIHSFKEILNLKSLKEHDVDLNKEPPFDLEDLHHGKGSMEDLLIKAESISKLSPIVSNNKKTIAWLFSLAAFFGLLAYAWQLLFVNKIKRI